MSEEERRELTRRQWRRESGQARVVHVTRAQRGGAESYEDTFLGPWGAPAPAPDLGSAHSSWDEPDTYDIIAEVISDNDGKEPPVFLPAESDDTSDAGVGEWWDNDGDLPFEMTSDPEFAAEVVTDALEEAEGAGDAPPSSASPAKEARALKKQAAADAKAAKKEAKSDKASSKKDRKLDSLSEAKRQAIVAKEQKAAEKKLLRDEQAELKIEKDDARARARRERQGTSDWKRKQKRREAIRRNGGKEGFWQGTSKPKPIEIANAVRSLAIILETSPAEVDAVKMMAEEFAGNGIGDAYDRIYSRLVKDNVTLVDAFAPEEIFPPVVHNMLRVGAKTAKPGAALRTAVDLMDSGNNNSRLMLNAVREPAILAVLSMVILFITAWVVMPTFVDMYDSLNMEVGIITGFVMVFADVSMWVIGILLAGLIGWLIWWFGYGRTSLRARIAIDRWKLHAPLIGKSEQSGEAFQMFNILDSYLSVGSTEREALLNTATAIQNRAIKRHLRAVANGLTRGEKTFAQFLDDDMFPRMARSILGAGQRTGQTVQVVRNLRDIYENESKIEGAQAVEKVVGVVSAFSSILFTVTATIVSIPPLEIFGATLGFKG